jgi:hypothetical protein
MVLIIFTSQRKGIILKVREDRFHLKCGQYNLKCLLYNRLWTNKSVKTLYLYRKPKNNSKVNLIVRDRIGMGKTSVNLKTCIKIKLTLLVLREVVQGKSR